jgi:hypothetical protein
MVMKLAPQGIWQAQQRKVSKVQGQKLFSLLFSHKKAFKQFSCASPCAGVG